LKFALNHVTVAHHGYTDFLDCAKRIGCVGVELRNDLKIPLFSGMTPREAKRQADDRGLEIIAVAEVQKFNHWNEERLTQARTLIEIASECGAQAVSLIPDNDGRQQNQSQSRSQGETGRQQPLIVSLEALKPLLEDAGLSGFIEPLGFQSSSLRFKSEVIDAIRALNAGDTFKIIHDTFHHALAGEESLYPEETAVIHISGVNHPDLQFSQMQDEHRVLVTNLDRLNNINQLTAMHASGFNGYVSFEAFAREVQLLDNPDPELLASIEFISAGLTPGAGVGNG